jgi:hypothetical protein
MRQKKIRRAPTGAFRHMFGATVAAVAALAPADLSHAYTAAGDRLFPATIILPQIAPSDEAYLTTATQPVSGGRQTSLTGVYSKSITERFAIQIEDGYSWLDRSRGSSAAGWQNFDATLRYLAIIDQPHEFLFSVGVEREFGGTGARRVGASRQGATQPTIYFGKGLGDFDAGYLRPVAITGFAGYQVADSNPRPNLWNAGIAIEYSMPYLDSKVTALSLPDFVRDVTPIVEILFATPSGNSRGVSTSAVVAPGINYAGEGWEFGIEALIPATRAAGTGVGVTAQFHLSLDFLFPGSIGKPLFMGQ